MTTERWLPIPGFETYYEVSDWGRVRSVERHVVGRIRPGQRRVRKGQLLRSRPVNHPTGRSTGHRVVSLSVEGVRHYWLVHALVMLAFVGPRPADMQICHSNGDATDNRLSNLRYGSASDNALDMVHHGSHNNARKTQCQRGHKYDEANTIVNSKGYRECRTCKKAVDRRYYERRMMRAADCPPLLTPARTATRRTA